ncbi:MAG: hypothetical protein M1833_001762 [Piccolia ochrophora]|nr:MAG: hypothetical protein M1833_001762 [Piccolia ochrophora]
MLGLTPAHIEPSGKILLARLLEEKAPLISQRTLEGVSWAGFALATLFVIFRFCIRRFKFGGFFADDGFVLLAWLCLLTLAICLHVMMTSMYTFFLVASGNMEAPPDIIPTANNYMKFQFVATQLFWACLWAVKCSFLAFFHRLSNGLKGERILWWCVAVFTGLSYVACVISYPIACPVFKVDVCGTPLHIQRALISLRFSTAVDIITDAMIIGLPIHLLWKVRISLRQKFALGGIFCLGFLIIIFSMVRVILTNSKTTHTEVTWLDMWSSIEATVAVVVSCLASFKALFNDPENVCTRQSGETAQGTRPSVSLPTLKPRSKFLPLGNLGVTTNMGINTTYIESELPSPNGTTSSSSSPMKDHIHVYSDFKVSDSPV